MQHVGPKTVAETAHGFNDYDETVVLLDKWPQSVAAHASRLAGRYTVMEDISGNFMRMQINGLAVRGKIITVENVPGYGESCMYIWRRLNEKSLKAISVTG